MKLFLFGNLGFFYTKLKTRCFPEILNHVELIDFSKDEGFPWRFYNNFCYLLNHFENSLINNIEDFNLFLDFFVEFTEKVKKCYKIEKITFSENFNSIKNLFSIVVISVSNKINERVNLFLSHNNKISVKKYKEKLKNYVSNKSFFFDFVTPYDETKWTSKWKLIMESKEVHFENIDVYLDNLIKHTNFYYNNNMEKTIEKLTERILFFENKCS